MPRVVHRHRFWANSNTLRARGLICPRANSLVYLAIGRVAVIADTCLHVLQFAAGGAMNSIGSGRRQNV